MSLEQQTRVDEEVVLWWICIIGRGVEKEAVRQNRVRVCNGSFLLVLDILSIQGIILRAVLYTMHSVDGIFNHLTSRPLPFKLFNYTFLVFLIL